VIAGVGDLLGLPEGFPGLGRGIAILRYLLLMLVAAWCAALARGRRPLAVAAAGACGTLAVGYWIAVLERPWGVLIEPGATRRAAELAVAAVAPEAGGFVVGEAPGAPVGRWLLGLGLPPALVQALPTLAPLAALLGLAAAVAVLWGCRDRAVLGASLVLVASTGDLGAAAGWGLLPGAWSRPLVAAAVPALVATVLALARVPRRAAAAGALAVPLLLVAIPGGAPLHLADAALAISVEQGLWVPLALLGLRAGNDTASRALVIGGGVAVLLAAAGLPLDAVGALALYRTGLILAGTTALWEALPTVMTAARRALPRLSPRWEARQVGSALLVAVLAPGSPLVWWNPIATDPTAGRSLEPLSPALEPSMEWIRAHTPPGAVFLASPAYSSALSVRTGRRVLRAPDVLRVSDEAERVRAERPLLFRRPLPERARRYGVGWVYVAPGDFQARGVDAPEDLLDQPGLALRYRDLHRIHVFEVLAGP